MDPTESPAPVWRKKKDRMQQPTGVTKPAPRAPSHLNTQIHDPGYKKIKALCLRLKQALGRDEDDSAVSTFVSHMETFVSSAGAQLLDRMQTKKKLVELVLEELKVAKRNIDTVLTEVDADHIFKVFPKTPKERNYDDYYSGMRAITERVNNKVRALLDADSVSRVKWDDDFDSDRFYVSTGGAGHGHGGPGM